MTARRSVSRSLLGCALAWFSFLWQPAQARAEERPGATDEPAVMQVVSVVEVAGNRAYLEPGVERGSIVEPEARINGQVFEVVSHNTKNIVVALGGRRARKGQRGVVGVKKRAIVTFAERPKPPPLAAFEDQWVEPVRPAETQSPKFVPLGPAAVARSKNRALVSVEHTRTMPLSGQVPAIDRTRLRALLHAELGESVVFDADASASVWNARDLEQRRGSSSRPWLEVRQLELGYRGDVLSAGIGRLRYASNTAGMLDGARASAAWGDGWSIGAFGGTLADPFDGAPSTEAKRFGGELFWQGLAYGAPSRAGIGVQGSEYQGALDERRLTALFESFPSFGRLGAHAELNLFDADNAWNAGQIELTAIGFDTSVRLSSLRLGASLDVRRPERSRRLASFLPVGYFCVTQPVPGAHNVEDCVDGVQRVAAALNAAWQAEVWTIDAGVTHVTTRLATAEQSTAYVGYRLREIAGAGRFDVALSAARGSLLESAAADVGVGAEFFADELDVSLHYRPSVFRYRAERVEILEHGFGSRVWLALGRELDLSLSADLLTSPDADVMLLQSALAWRPRF